MKGAIFGTFFFAFVYLTFQLVLIVGIIWVAVHFIRKAW